MINKIKFLKFRYFKFILRRFLLKIKYGEKLEIKSIWFGIEKGTKILLNSKFSKIKIGKKVYLYRHGNLEAHNNSEIIIGNNVSINKNFSIVSRKKIQIGNKVFIGPNVCIYDHDHVIIDKDMIAPDQQNFISKPIIIGNNVWIGANVFIAKGVNIGDNCVIGAGSIVTKNISSNSICMGVSASIKKRF